MGKHVGTSDDAVEWFWVGSRRRDGYGWHSLVLGAPGAAAAAADMGRRSSIYDHYTSLLLCDFRRHTQCDSFMLHQCGALSGTPRFVCCGSIYGLW